MKLAWVVGNGESRRGVALEHLQSHGTVFVCNQAVYDTPADHAIAVDRSMVMQIASQGYPANTKLWTRARWTRQLSHEREIHALPSELYPPSTRWDRELHWGSGTHAAWQAAVAHDVVVLIGFDLWSSNIYQQHAAPVNPEHWIYQLAQTFDRHPAVQFVQIQPQGWTMPQQWNSCKNLSLDNMSSLQSLS